MMWRRVGVVALVLVVLGACRGSSPSAQTITQRQLESLVDSLMPLVAKSTGLEFKFTPKAAIRSRDQIHMYLIAKMARELPDARVDGISATYRLLGLMPDGTDLRALLLSLYTEQIAGFFEPDSATFFAVSGTDPAALTLTVAHELVHALQSQYVPLDSILHDVTDGDRQTAAQAIMEGQATLASVAVLAPGQDVRDNDAVWQLMREQLARPQNDTTALGRAPLAIREGLIFPYLEGSEFERWFERTHPGKTPYGAALPQSTEQLLHPDRYAAGDRPIDLRFSGDTTGVLFEDTFGEFQIDVVRAQLLGTTDVRTDPAIGWGGDRLRIYRTPAGPALVWVTAWDEPRWAAQFQKTIAEPLAARPRPGYRSAAEPLSLGSRSGVRIVIAPAGWDRWKSLPGAEIH